MLREDMERHHKLTALLVRQTAKIRDRRQVRNGYELACELLERAWIEMLLRDFWSEMTRPELAGQWTTYMRWDIADAQTFYAFGRKTA